MERTDCKTCSVKLRSGYMTNRCGSFCDTYCWSIWAMDTIEKLQADQDRAFSVLEMYGIPKERAKSVDNGIQVFDSRMQKEVQSLGATIGQLQKDKDELVGCLESLWREIHPIVELLNKHQAHRSKQ